MFGAHGPPHVPQAASHRGVPNVVDASVHVPAPIPASKLPSVICAAAGSVRAKEAKRVMCFMRLVCGRNVSVLSVTSSVTFDGSIHARVFATDSLGDSRCRLHSLHARHPCSQGPVRPTWSLHFRVHMQAGRPLSKINEKPRGGARDLSTVGQQILCVVYGVGRGPVAMDPDFKSATGVRNGCGIPIPTTNPDTPLWCALVNPHHSDYP